MAFVATNNLDEVAIYLGINRLNGEEDSDFLSRIKRIGLHRYGTDPKTSQVSINDTTGLLLQPIILLYCKYPYKIKIDNEFITIRVFKDGEIKFASIYIANISDQATLSSLPLYRLKSYLDSHTELFSYDIVDQSLMNTSNEFIFNNFNYNIGLQEIKAKKTKLHTKNIIPGTLTSSTFIFSNRVSSIPDIQKIGDYYYDDEIRYLEIATDNPNRFTLSYEEYDKHFMIEKTPISLMPVLDYAKFGFCDRFIELLEIYLSERGIG
jgi:hypothetical protein